MPILQERPRIVASPMEDRERRTYVVYGARFFPVDKEAVHFDQQGNTPAEPDLINLAGQIRHRVRGITNVSVHRASLASPDYMIIDLQRSHYGEMVDHEIKSMLMDYFGWRDRLVDKVADFAASYVRAAFRSAEQFLWTHVGGVKLEIKDINWAITRRVDRHTRRTHGRRRRGAHIER